MHVITGCNKCILMSLDIILYVNRVIELINKILNRKYNYFEHSRDVYNLQGQNNKKIMWTYSTKSTYLWWTVDYLYCNYYVFTTQTNVPHLMQFWHCFYKITNIFFANTATNISNNNHHTSDATWEEFALIQARYIKFSA